MVNLDELKEEILTIGETIKTLKSTTPSDKDAIGAAVAALLAAKQLYADHNDGIGVDGQPFVKDSNKKDKKKAVTTSTAGSAETTTVGDASKQVRRYFKRLLNDDKNIDYFDQVYYELGNIEYREKNIPPAVKDYTYSILFSKTNVKQKSLSYYALAKLYFAQPEYTLAQAYYDTLGNVMPPDFPDSKKINAMRLVLGELIKNLTVIQTEDSLQVLAKLSPEELEKKVKQWQEVEKQQVAQAEKAKKESRKTISVNGKENDEVEGQIDDIGGLIEEELDDELDDEELSKEKLEESIVEEESNDTIEAMRFKDELQEIYSIILDNIKDFRLEFEIDRNVYVDDTFVERYIKYINKRQYTDFIIPPLDVSDASQDSMEEQSSYTESLKDAKKSNKSKSLTKSSSLLSNNHSTSQSHSLSDIEKRDIKSDLSVSILYELISCEYLHMNQYYKNFYYRDLFQENLVDMETYIKKFLYNDQSTNNEMSDPVKLLKAMDYFIHEICLRWKNIFEKENSI